VSRRGAEHVGCARRGAVRAQAKASTSRLKVAIAVSMSLSPCMKTASSIFISVEASQATVSVVPVSSGSKESVNRSYPLVRHPCVASRGALQASSPREMASMTSRYVPCHHSRCHRCRDVTPRGGDARVPPRTPHFRRSEPISESREGLWGSTTYQPLWFMRLVTR
jgi:hypothetical protein